MPFVYGYEPMSHVKHITVDADRAGQRLDNFCLSQFSGVPKMRIYRAIRKGEVRVNKARAKATYRIKAGDLVRLPPINVKAKPAPKHISASQIADIEQCVIEETPHWLVLDKPSGMAVHGGSGISLGVIETLRAARPDAPYLELVHRLDRDTSGCLLVAKRRSALRAIHEAIREREVEKKYLLLVKGHWDLGEQRCRLPLDVVLRGKERHAVVDEAGKHCETIFKPVQMTRRASLIEARLETGRMHQIRAHATALEHPLLGDTRYGDEESLELSRELGVERLCLHAHWLSFNNPRSGEPECYSSPLPDELRQILDRLTA